MDSGVGVNGKEFGFMVDNIVVCVCSVASCYSSYLVLDYLKLIEVCG